MRSNALVNCLIVTGFLVTSSVARAQVVQTSANTSSSADPQKLVVGDWYDVAIQRQGVSLKTSGVLLQATDEWIVLADVATNTQEKKTGTPLLMYLPYVGSSFRYTKVLVENTKNYRWVPRNGMNIERHSTHIEEKDRLIFPSGEAPKFGEQLVVSYVKDDKPARFGVDAKGKQIDETLRDLTKTVPLDHVLIVNSQSPLTPAELKLIKAK